MVVPTNGTSRCVLCTPYTIRKYGCVFVCGCVCVLAIAEICVLQTDETHWNTLWYVCVCHSFRYGRQMYKHVLAGCAQYVLELHIQCKVLFFLFIPIHVHGMILCHRPFFTMYGHVCVRCACVLVFFSVSHCTPFRRKIHNIDAEKHCCWMCDEKAFWACHFSMHKRFVWIFCS